VCHVGLDQMTSSESCTKRELTGKNTSSNNTCELASIVTGVCRMGTTDAKQVEHGGLGLENCTTTNGTNFDTRHRDRDLEVTTKTIEMLAYDSTDVRI
jgi:hypothetical protein